MMGISIVEPWTSIVSIVTTSADSIDIIEGIIGLRCIMAVVGEADSTGDRRRCIVESARVVRIVA